MAVSFDSLFLLNSRVFSYDLARNSHSDPISSFNIPVIPQIILHYNLSNSTMLSRFAPLAARTAARSLVAAPASRSFSSVGHTTAAEAAAMSGYSNIEFRIDEDSMVIEAVQQFAANNIGCLVTVNDAGMFFPKE